MSKAMVTNTNRGIAGLGAGPSILGQRKPHLRADGKIRSGIKVLTPTAAKNQDAVAIYEAGIKQGRKFDDIERDIRGKLNNNKSPLMPKNVPYFVVRPGDFANPETAKQIMETYAEDRGEGRHLYRFPVVFAMDNWQAVMPHSLQCWSASELMYWSEYGDDGKRYCMTRLPVARDASNQRAKRVFGGRETVRREENGGVCNPESCPQYQSRACMLKGQLFFYIPGIGGLNPIRVDTTSFYSMAQWKETMEMVNFIRGRLSGKVENQPVFYLTKKLEEVSMIDPDGKPKRVKQWLMHLDADLDMTRLMQDDTPLLEQVRGTRAVRTLTVMPVEDVETVDQPPAAPVDPDKPETAVSDEVSVTALRARLNDGVRALGISPIKFAEYGLKQWGEQWGSALDKLKEADQLLNTAADDKRVLDKLKKEMGE